MIKGKIVIFSYYPVNFYQEDKLYKECNVTRMYTQRGVEGRAKIFLICGNNMGIANLGYIFL